MNPGGEIIEAPELVVILRDAIEQAHGITRFCRHHRIALETVKAALYRRNTFHAHLLAALGIEIVYRRTR